ncbi:hypothetical protein K438DRAFT_1974367 [Mycena galopus ATCC 62051]|nr:hypothetical protein K438DRAFT_1974367 [Mycena galopus ATCC 62051]
MYSVAAILVIARASQQPVAFRPTCISAARCTHSTSTSGCDPAANESITRAPPRNFSSRASRGENIVIYGVRSIAASLAHDISSFTRPRIATCTSVPPPILRPDYISASQLPPRPPVSLRAGLGQVRQHHCGSPRRTASSLHLYYSASPLAHQLPVYIAQVLRAADSTCPGRARADLGFP